MQISNDSQQVSPAPSYRNTTEMSQKDELFFLTSNMNNAGTYPNWLIDNVQNQGVRGSK